MCYLLFLFSTITTDSIIQRSEEAITRSTKKQDRWSWLSEEKRGLVTWWPIAMEQCGGGRGRHRGTEQRGCDPTRGPTTAPGRVSPRRLPHWLRQCHRGRCRRRGCGCRLLDLHHRWVRVLRAALPPWPPFCPSARELIRRERTMEAMAAAYCLGRAALPRYVPRGRRSIEWDALLARATHTRGCGYFTVNRTEELRTVDFPTVRFFSYFSKFFVVFWFQEIFSEKKKLRKKDRKFWREKF